MNMFRNLFLKHVNFERKIKESSQKLNTPNFSLYILSPAYYHSDTSNNSTRDVNRTRPKQLATAEPGRFSDTPWEKTGFKSVRLALKWYLQPEGSL